MSGLRATLVFVLCGMCSVAYAHNLHVGDMSFALNQNKTTSPALGVSIDGATVYGALYSGTAPGQTLHVYRDIDYWLGQNCAAGKYSETGVSACTDCTIGHYCPGGAYNVPCTGGAIACPGTNHTANAATDASMLNRLLTLDEVNEFIPVTDLSQWTRVSACYEGPKCQSDCSGQQRNRLECGCANGILEPGTYLFVAQYNDVHLNASIAVFDHPVGYMLQHSCAVFEIMVDTDNAPFQSWTFHTAYFTADENNTNVTGLNSLLRNMYIFKLK